MAESNLGTKRRYCEHCGEFVSRTVFYQHQKELNRLDWSVRFEFTPPESQSPPLNSSTSDAASRFEFDPEASNDHGGPCPNRIFHNSYDHLEISPSPIEETIYECICTVHVHVISVSTVGCIIHVHVWYI